MQLHPVYAGRHHPIAHVEVMPTRGESVGLVSSALRVSLAAVLFYFCAQDWPAVQARNEFEALPLMHAKAPTPNIANVPDAVLLHRAAQKGPKGIEFVTIHGAQMAQDHPLLALYPGTPPAQLRGALRDWSPQIMGIAGAWMLFEFLVFAARARRAAQPKPA